MLSALFFSPPAVWAAFSGCIVGLALWEYSRLAGLTGFVKWAYLGLSGLLAWAAWVTGLILPVWAHFGVLAFWLLLAPLWLAKRWRLTSQSGAMLLGWVMLFPCWFAFIELRPAPQAAYTLLAVMGLVWVADVAAYFSGRAFGKRKLAPAISPGKSWAGVYGAMLAVVAYAALVTHLGWVSVSLPLLILVPLALALTMVSVEGDLLESWFKRAAGIKDSSTLLPGHGG
ncbi:phosphatidate cytidylyltransferase, partial [Craterilacuibacter sp.]|uniref:phosphatidate cytidylyltransferase n=1 Tax=Craterilacuibacter sp. TaxID=2870909 RepID=UPI003F66AC6F